MILPMILAVDFFRMLLKTRVEWMIWGVATVAYVCGAVRAGVGLWRTLGVGWWLRRLKSWRPFFGLNIWGAKPPSPWYAPPMTVCNFVSLLPRYKTAISTSRVAYVVFPILPSTINLTISDVTFVLWVLDYKKSLHEPVLGSRPMSPINQSINQNIYFRSFRSIATSLYHCKQKP